MESVTWLTFLTNEIAMSKGFASELERQLRTQAHALAGIDLADGGYSLATAESAFTVQYRTVANSVIGIIEADLVDPAARGHAVALGMAVAHPPRSAGGRATTARAPRGGPMSCRAGREPDRAGLRRRAERLGSDVGGRVRSATVAHPANCRGKKVRHVRSRRELHDGG